MSLGPSDAGFAFGPIELNVISFAAADPPSDLLSALTELVCHGNVRILDVVLVARSATGTMGFRELEIEDPNLTRLTLHARGLISEEDLDVLAQCVPRASTAAVVALEPTWAREFAERVLDTGSVIVATVQIPGTAVNAAIDIALEG